MNIAQQLVNGFCFSMSTCYKICMDSRPAATTSSTVKTKAVNEKIIIRFFYD